MDVGPSLARDHHAVALDLAGFGQTPLYNRSAARRSQRRPRPRLHREGLRRARRADGQLDGRSHLDPRRRGPPGARCSRLVLVDPAVPGVHVRRPAPPMLGAMATLSVPGLAENLLDRRLKSVSAEQLVRETLALVCADPSRLSREIVDAHVQLTRERARLGTPEPARVSAGDPLARPAHGRPEILGARQAGQGACARDPRRARSPHPGRRSARARAPRAWLGARGARRCRSRPDDGDPRSLHEGCSPTGWQIESSAPPFLNGAPTNTSTWQRSRDITGEAAGKR